MAFGPIPSWKIEGEKVKGMTDFLFLGAEITADGDWSHEVRRWLLLGREAMPKPDSMLKSKDIIFLTKVCIFKAMVFPVVTYGCESWIIKKAELQRIWCLWNVVLENILENPLESKETKPINLKGSQLCILIGRTDAEAEAPILWPPDMKSWRIGKDLDARKDWGHKGKRVSEDEMGGCHHWYNGHELGQTPGDVRDAEACCAAYHGFTKSLTWLGKLITATANRIT